MGRYIRFRGKDSPSDLPDLLIGSNQGFSLIELMVALVVIGTLSSIAVPRFRAAAARARQAEAKTQLAALLVAEKSFFVANGSFTMCLKQAGYSALENARRYYVLGFWGTDPVQCGPNGASPCYAYEWNTPSLCNSLCAGFPTDQDDTTYRATAKISESALMLDTCEKGDSIEIPRTWVARRDTFNAGAAGNISDEDAYDFWQIDQAGNLVNIRPSIQ